MWRCAMGPADGYGVVARGWSFVFLPVGIGGQSRLVKHGVRELTDADPHVITDSVGR